MKPILRLIFKGSKIKPPSIILNTFKAEFGETKNVEWFNEGENYEVIFYKGKTEHIAYFNSGGQLTETKINLPLIQAKPEVLDAAAQVGELMNLIEIKRGETVYYEIIARDKELTRHTLLLDSLGVILEQKKL